MCPSCWGTSGKRKRQRTSERDFSKVSTVVLALYSELITNVPVSACAIVRSVAEVVQNTDTQRLGKAVFLAYLKLPMLSEYLGTELGPGKWEAGAVITSLRSFRESVHLEGSSSTGKENPTYLKQVQCTGSSQQKSMRAKCSYVSSHKKELQQLLDCELVLPATTSLLEAKSVLVHAVTQRAGFHLPKTLYTEIWITRTVDAALGICRREGSLCNMIKDSAKKRHEIYGREMVSLTDVRG